MGGGEKAKEGANGGVGEPLLCKQVTRAASINPDGHESREAHLDIAHIEGVRVVMRKQEAQAQFGCRLARQDGLHDLRKRSLLASLTGVTKRTRMYAQGNNGC